MKFSSNRALALVVISSAFLLAAAGCKKSSSSNSGGSGSMSATVAGTAWNNSFATVGVYTSIPGSGGSFEVVGIQIKSADSTAFELLFSSPFALNQPVGTDSSSLVVAYTDSKSLSSYTALAGLGNAVLTVTSYDSTGHTIAGTFSGSLYNTGNYSDSIVVTNGKFNSAFTVQ
jgi:hypothetical protein